MKRKLLNNKGFTLIEIIIATVIFSIIVGAIYLVLNSSINLAENQTKTTTGQQTINILLRYLNEDIKSCQNIKELESDNGYVLDLGNQENITYEITTQTKGDKKLYSITRTIENSQNSINIVSNLEVRSDIKPLVIKKEDNMYNVQIGYLNKTYAFDIYSRIG